MSGKALLLVLLLALLAPLLAPYPAGQVDLSAELSPPSRAHLLGAGENGVDLLSELLHGARLSFTVAVLAVLLAAALGATIGSLAAAAGGMAEGTLMRVTDAVVAFPGMLFALLLASVLGPSPWNVVAALALSGWPAYARLVRAQVRSVLAQDHVLAARALGATEARVLWRHVLPHALGPLFAHAAIALPGALLAEAALSFLGLGAPPGTPSWGALVDQGTQYLLVAPHVALVPGAALVLLVLLTSLAAQRLHERLLGTGRG